MPLEVLLTVGGFQVPVIGVGLLLDDVGNTGAVAPEHIGAGVINVGVTPGLTVISIVTTVAHCVGLGVKVYVVVPGVELLTTAGDQVPVIGVLFVDDVGSVGAVVPKQKDGI